MRTLEPKRQQRDWEPLTKALPLLTVVLTFALFIFILGILQYVGGNY